MNDERNAQIIRLWNEYLSAREIAEKIGVSTHLVDALIFRRRASGEVTRPKVSASRNDERNAKIVALWNKGLSAKEVSDLMGCTKNVVLAAVVKHRALGDITRPMVESRSERAKLAVIARRGLRRKSSAKTGAEK